MLIKLKIHSMVDVITNSSTVIYTCQNSIKEAKELVQEVLNISGITDKTPEDVFYYGVFCEDDIYFDSIGDNEDGEMPEGIPKIDYDTAWNSEERKEQNKAQEKWLDDLKLSIIKGEITKPDWMEEIEIDEYEIERSNTLYLVPKDDKFKDLAEKISNLLGSVTAEEVTE